MTEADWLACTDPYLLLGALRGGSDRKLRLFACACVRELDGLVPGEQGWQTVRVAERFADGEATAEELMAARNAPGEPRPAGMHLTAWRAARAAATATSSPAAWSAAANAARAAARLRAVQSVCAAAGGRRPDLLPDIPTSLEAAWARVPPPGPEGGTALAAPPRRSATRPQRLEDNPAWKAAWVDGRTAAGGRHVELLRDVFGNPFRPTPVDPAWLSWRDGTVAKLARAFYAEGRFGDLPVLGDALEEAGCDDPALLAHCRGPGPHSRGCWVVDLLLGKG